MTAYPNKNLFLSFPGSKDVIKNFSTEGKQFYASLIWKLPEDIEHSINILENHCNHLETRKYSNRKNHINSDSIQSNSHISQHEHDNILEQEDGILNRNLNSISFVESFIFRYTICQLAIILHKSKVDSGVYNLDYYKKIMCQNITKCVKNAEKCTHQILLFRILFRAFEIFFFEGSPSDDLLDKLQHLLKLTIETIIFFGYCRKNLLRLIQVSILLEYKLKGQNASKLLESKFKLEYTLRFVQFPQRISEIDSCLKNLLKHLSNVDLKTEIHIIGSFITLLHPRDVFENHILQEWVFKYQRHAPGFPSEYEENIEASERLVVLTIIHERYEYEKRGDIRNQLEKMLLPKGIERQRQLLKKLLGSSKESVSRTFSKILSQNADVSIVKPNITKINEGSNEDEIALNKKILSDSMIEKIEKRISKIVEYMNIISNEKLNDVEIIPKIKKSQAKKQKNSNQKILREDLEDSSIIEPNDDSSTNIIRSPANSEILTEELQSNCTESIIQDDDSDDCIIVKVKKSKRNLHKKPIFNSINLVNTQQKLTHPPLKRKANSNLKRESKRQYIEL